MTNHAFLAYPNESGHQGNIILGDFIKVVRNKDDSEYNEGDNGECGVIIGVKSDGLASGVWNCEEVLCELIEGSGCIILPCLEDKALPYSEEQGITSTTL